MDRSRHGSCERYFQPDRRNVTVTQKNDILREIIVRSGEFHLSSDNKALERFAGDGQMVNPGEEISKGLTSEQMKFVQAVETPEGKGLLLRPVEEYTIPNEAQLPELSHINQATGPHLGSPCNGLPSRTTS